MSSRLELIDTATIRFEQILESDRYRKILRYLGKEISTAMKKEFKIREVMNGEANPQEYTILESFLRDELEYIEILTGMSFLVCQHRITSIVSAALEADKSLKTYKIQVPLLQVPKSSIRQQLLEKGKKLGNTGISVVKAIDASANKYKHSDEWPTWEKAKESHKGAKKTIETLESIGVKDMRSANIIKLAKILGNKRLGNPIAVLTHIDEWAKEILDEIFETIIFKKQHNKCKQGHANRK